MNEDKCTKYEGLFIFSDEDTLQKHIEECEECKKEHEKMQKVSSLLSEVKLYYKAKRKKIRKLKAACAVLGLILFSTTFGVISNNEDIMDRLMYGSTLTAEDFDLPVDSYGLITVDNEF